MQAALSQWRCFRWKYVKVRKEKRIDPIPFKRSVINLNNLPNLSPLLCPISYHTFLYIPPPRYSLVPQILLSQLPYNKLPKNYFIVNHFSKVQTAFVPSVSHCLQKLFIPMLYFHEELNLILWKEKLFFSNFLEKFIIPRIFLIRDRIRRLVYTQKSLLLLS